MKYSDWLLSFNGFLSFCFSSTKQHYSTSEIHMYRVYFHQATMGKSYQKIEKIQNHPSVQKSYSTSCKGIGGRKNKEKIVKVKPQHWCILIIWKSGNKIKVVKAGGRLKILCHWQSPISELLLSASKIPSFWSKF